jgi:UV DNA damage repair endonuclease
MIRLGYAAQNLTIPATTSRTLRLASLHNIEKVCRLIRENLASLETILQWNDEHEFKLFRIGLIGSPDSVLVLHIGGNFGDKLVTTTRFVETMGLEENVLKYLALENDERIWHVADIVKVAQALGIAAIAHTLHNRLNPGGHHPQRGL